MQIELVTKISSKVTPNTQLLPITYSGVYIPLINPYEVFTQCIYKDQIVPDYYVSNFGRVYNATRGYFLSQSFDKDGYPRVSIKVGDKYKTVKVHRIELMSFIPIYNSDDFEGNHKDGNKSNNFLWNLEWATPMDNTRHGWDNDLNHNIGTQNGNGKLTEKTVRFICEQLELGKRNNEICDIMGVTEKVDRMRLSAIISSIRHGKTHKYIACDYNIEGSKGKQRYDEEYSHEVCKILEQDNLTYEDVMNILEIPQEDRVLFKVYVNDILRGRTAKNISKLYDIKKPIY